MSHNKRAGQTDWEIQEDQSFINTQHQKLTDLIAQAVAAVMMIQQADNESAADDFSNSTNLINSVTRTEVESALQLTYWKADKIDLFDPYLNKSHEEGEIITVEKNIYYQSVVLFIE